ncbi:MAG: 3'(2'),5'-bisphosphate nucleotidase CysQ [Geminicoccaceae bacterium]
MSLDAALVEGTRSAVAEAGRIAMRYFRQAHGRWEKGPGQVVTDADIEVDRFLRSRLGALAPDAGWLSEETADDGSRLSHARVWVVDPIDGTRSFAEGKPEFTICVALLEQGRPVLGCILNPATGERFHAERGGGAWLDSNRLRVIEPDGIAGARVGLSRTEKRRDAIAAALPEAERLDIGSLAYKLALIAAGRIDAYVSLRRSHDWDIAAADLLLAEAGARLSDAAGAPIRYDLAVPSRQGLVAAAAKLHAALVARIAGLTTA